MSNVKCQMLLVNVKWECQLTMSTSMSVQVRSVDIMRSQTMFGKPKAKIWEREPGKIYPKPFLCVSHFQTRRKTKKEEPGK